MGKQLGNLDRAYLIYFSHGVAQPPRVTFVPAQRHATSYDELLSPMRNFIQVFRWRAVKSGTDDDSFKTRYKRSGNGLSTIIVDPLKHLLDACSRVSRERERRFLLAFINCRYIDKRVQASFSVF